VDKVMTMNDKTNRFSPELFAAISDLAESLERSEAVSQFSETHQKFLSDQNAIQLIKEAGELQRKVYAGDSVGADLEADLTRLHELQSLISTNAIIQEQSIAQEAAVAFLQEINQEISQLLGFDFASLTRRPGAGC
jgi:cell fate (sporulation/competence/biofilm development) regulator YlbF (YheA/YmcA/DUF963 family)